MLTKSGLDPKKFESNGVVELGTGLENIYTAQVPTKLYTLTNKNGMEVCITNFGCRIVSMMVPDKDNNLKDVVLGFDSIKEYADFNGNPTYFGCVVGRFANRIAGGKYKIEGKEYSLDLSEGVNCLHGGIYNWSFQTFSVEDFDQENNIITFKLISPDGDCGFEGEVVFYVTYCLTEDNSLDVFYEATTNRNTVINVTNHSFFNLTGNAEDVLNHKLWINSNWATPLREGVIPSGSIVPIESGSPLDFSVEKTVGKDINADDPQIKLGGGYDHNFVLNQSAAEGDAAACLYNPDNGICLTVFTTEPGMQLYEWNNNNSMKGKNGAVYEGNQGICLETQNFPDAPNIPHFPTAVLRPGEVFESYTSYSFNVR